MSDVTVINNADRSRYEARLDNQLAGRLEYQVSPDHITFVHTAVEDEFQGSKKVRVGFAALFGDGEEDLAVWSGVAVGL